MLRIVTTIRGALIGSLRRLLDAAYDFDEFGEVGGDGGTDGRAGVGESAAGVGPVEVGEVKLALLLILLIGVGGAVVAVEAEVAVGAGVDAELGDLLDLVGALDGSAERKDRASADEERDGVDGR